MDYDVVIVGGGVVGCAAARELSRYRLRVALLEGGHDVSLGASRANSGIVHSGYDAKPDSVMAGLNVRGNALYERMCDELGVSFSRIGSLTVAFDDKQAALLRELYEQGVANGVPDISIISGDEARKREPLLSSGVVSALFAPTAGIVSPYQLTIALMENARENGVDILLNARVDVIDAEADGFTIRAGGEAYRASYIINAAGVFADEVARLIGDDSFKITPRKGEYIMLDRGASDVKYVLFQTPSDMGKGIVVSPTVDGNAYIGPTADDISDKTDSATLADSFAKLRRLGALTVPGVDMSKQITQFAGIRAISDTGDFIIKPSERHPRFIHAAGISSPGLTSSPAIAEELAGLLRVAGLTLVDEPSFNPIRRPIERFENMPPERKQSAIEDNPLYGHIICRCETVTEAEIVEAVRRGATSVDAVKRRVRAGLGRCQGGFCMPRIIEIIARELNIPTEQVPKSGKGSNIVLNRTRKLKS